VTLRIPEGYLDRRCGSLRIVAVRRWSDEMKDLLVGPGRDERADASLGGRGGTRRVLVGGTAFYLRRCLRGGLVRLVTRDLYLARPPRPLRELVVTETARSAHCLVPKIVAVCVQPHGPFYRGWVVSEEIPGGRSWYSRYRGAGVAERRRLLEAAGRAMRSLVRVGVYHADLNATNLLYTGKEKVAVIDFDHAVLARPGSERRSRRVRKRFWRSLAKLETRAGVAPTAEERGWLERGYEL